MSSKYTARDGWSLDKLAKECVKRSRPADGTTKQLRDRIIYDDTKKPSIKGAINPLAATPAYLGPPPNGLPKKIRTYQPSQKAIQKRKYADPTEVYESNKRSAQAKRVMKKKQIERNQPAVASQPEVMTHKHWAHLLCIVQDALVQEQERIASTIDSSAWTPYDPDATSDDSDEENDVNAVDDNVAGEAKDNV